MTLDRRTQEPISVTNQILTLKHKGGEYKLPLSAMAIINYDNIDESVTITFTGDERFNYTIHLTDPFGNAIESDSTARDLAIRIINLLES